MLRSVFNSVIHKLSKEVILFKKQIQIRYTTVNFQHSIDYYKSFNMAEKEFQRVLSIQSHVVHGYVGNKSATFPLQILGFEVDTINSVQFSNHTGYDKVAGQILTDNDLEELMSGLAANKLDSYTHLLTGYVGNSTFLNRIAQVVKDLKAKNEGLIYVCDPVMGDNGKMYVPNELLPLYKNLILPLADIFTPNQFEVELLTDRKINKLEDAWEAVDELHTHGCKTVVLSSTELGNKDFLIGLASSKNDDGAKTRVMIEIPKLSKSFTGSGDLFASLFLAWMYKTNNNIKESLEKTIATMQCVLKRTLKHAEERGYSTKHMELKLIQSKLDIEKPNVVIFAKEL